MCNRYQQAAMQEAKEALAAIIETPFNMGRDLVHPQSPGLVVRYDKGQRILASMTAAIIHVDNVRPTRDYSCSSITVLTALKWYPKISLFDHSW